MTCSEANASRRKSFLAFAGSVRRRAGGHEIRSLSPNSQIPFILLYIQPDRAKLSRSTVLVMRRLMRQRRRRSP
jgi:hypothetical protein